MSGKVQMRRYFAFAIARWRLCASKTFEILPLPTCTLWQQKILYLQRYSTDFRNLCISSKMLTVGIGWKGFRLRRYFTFAMARWKLCASTTFEILPLSTCTLLPAKILYLQRYLTDFRNLCISSKMLRVGIWVESFRMRRYFTFAIARWKLCASTTFEILPLSTCILCHFSKPIFELIELCQVGKNLQRYS